MFSFSPIGGCRQCLGFHVRGLAHFFALYIILLGGLSTPAVTYVLIVGGFCPPLYVLISVVIIIQVADCTVDFSYVYMLHIILY